MSRTSDVRSGLSQAGQADIIKKTVDVDVACFGLLIIRR